MNSLCHDSHEEVVAALQNQESLKDYEAVAATYQVHGLPKWIGSLMVFLGNLVYGKRPSYGKFKAIEIIARIPYQSWEVASYLLLTFLYGHEEKAVHLSKISWFSRIAQDNETMHVIVISQLAKKHDQDSWFRHTCIPIAFSFFYFAASFFLYLLRPRYSFQFNYVFECHAYLQYRQFLKEQETFLRSQPMSSVFLQQYGRTPKNEYEFFQSVMIDELIHRNQSYNHAEHNEA